jgi:ferritin-like protein
VRATRRQALAGGAAAALTAAAPARAASADDERRDRERRAVSDAVAAEQATAVAFEAIANGDFLDEHQAGTMRILLDQAKAHATGLADLFEKTTGEDAPLPPRRTEIPDLSRVHTGGGALRLAERISAAAIATHLDAIRLTRNSAVLKLIAGAMGTDAQHLVMLRQLLGQDPAPAPFERGGPKSALP